MKFARRIGAITLRAFPYGPCRDAIDFFVPVPSADAPMRF